MLQYVLMSDAYYIEVNVNVTQYVCSVLLYRHVYISVFTAISI